MKGRRGAGGASSNSWDGPRSFSCSSESGGASLARTYDWSAKSDAFDVRAHLKRSAIALSTVVTLVCHAEGLICHMEPPTLSHDGSIAINFSSRAEWDFINFAQFEDLYIREGRVLHIPFGKDIVENVGPLRLKHGEKLRLYRPHEGCSIEAVIEPNRAGLLVTWGFVPPGSNPSKDKVFLPVKAQSR